jgi:hypothetical protein
VGAPAGPRFDPARPLEALALDADAVARAMGPFSWEAEVRWRAERAGASPVQATERHRLRQLPSGDFDVSAEIDPGTGPGSETGKQVVFVGGKTFAHGRWAPFRERPTDRGEDARRFRDESFRMAADLAALYGPALVAEQAGETSVLGRRARRYRLALSPSSPPRPSAPPPALPGGRYDADTQRHVAFLEGRVPTAAEGELLLDAQSGAPVRVTLRGSFARRDDAELRVEVELSARVTAQGGAVAVVQAPAKVQPDERKPKGVARALEAAGLRKRSAPPPPAEEEEPEGD